MTKEEKFDYWLDIAQYDIITAEAMYTSGRWLYVIFMCQQSLEKLVKGLYTLYIGDKVPQIHDINSIFSKFKDNLTVPVEESTIQLFSRLSSFYLNTRYPEFKTKLSSVVDRQDAENTLNSAKEVFAWLLTLKPLTESSDNTSTK
ncbi:DNA-binding protein [Spirochaetia bacterium]|nr:DNA-binding protein [Spirochaetia bacterium]